MVNTTFVQVCDVSDVPEKGGHRVRVGTQDVALFRMSTGELRAFKDACPHQQVSLASGMVNAGELTCPGHVWRFRLSDGQCVFGNTEICLRSYPVRVEGNRVLVAA